MAFRLNIREIAKSELKKMKRKKRDAAAVKVAEPASAAAAAPSRPMGEMGRDELIEYLNNMGEKVERKVETINPKAYEFFLKAKHKYNKRKNTVDTEIVRDYEYC